MPTPAPELACNLLAISAKARPQHIALSEKLFASALEVQELSDGYGFRLPVTSESLLQAAQFIANERLCCPFFTFTLKVEPNESGMWLMLTGEEGVKEVAAAELNVEAMKNNLTSVSVS